MTKPKLSSHTETPVNSVANPLRTRREGKPVLRMTPTPQFVLMWQPDKWDIYDEIGDGEILPTLTKYHDRKGLNNVHEGSSVIQHESYINQILHCKLITEDDAGEVFNQRMDNIVGYVHLAPWEVAYSGAETTTIDWNEYRDFCYRLIEQGIIQMPTLEQVLVKREKLIQLIDNAKGRQPVNTVRLKKLEKKLAILERYLPTEEPESEPVTTKSRGK